MFRLITFGGVGLKVVGEGAGSAERARPPELSPRAYALLALLAAAPGSGVSRDTLLACLWPESDTERGRNALRQALHTLKRDLAAPELLTGGVALRLDPRYVTSDVEEFAAARAAGEHARAVALYAGPFLDGFHLSNAPEFEPWVEARRAEYAAQAVSMLEALARGAEAEGNRSAAVEWWRRLAALDPLSARGAMGLMEALAAAGDGPAALRHAQAYEELIRRELGVGADPQLATLVERIRSGRLAGSRSPDRPAAPARAGDSPPEPLTRERLKDRLIRELSARYIVEQEVPSARKGPVRAFQARDIRHNRQVTLRVLHQELASQLDTARFLREIRLTGELLHPHIVPLLESGEVLGCPWYAVPRVESETLRGRLAREIRLPPDEAIRLGREIADALAFAHEHGIVHRDVHPENILLVGEHALLANLGVARALDRAAEGSLTDTGMVVGSPAYMSPEQAEGGAVDERCDQYALAAVVVEMLTGEPLFSGPTPQAILAKRAAQPMPSESSLPGVPPSLRPVLLQALALRPGHRFRTMAAFQEALAAPASFDARRPWWSRVSRRLAELLSQGRQRAPEPPGSSRRAG